MLRVTLCTIIFLTLSLQNCFSFDFIDSTFDGFSKRIVTAEYQTEFKNYYTNFMKKIDLIGKNSLVKKNTELCRLRNLAFYSLENKHPEWALQLKPYALYEKDEADAANKQSRSIRIFLTRYAVYEEFLKNIAQERAGVWYRLKSYTKHVGSKVVTFFNGFKGKEQKRA